MKELPAGYYLTNFLEIISYTQAHYSDLLDKTEHQFLEDFNQLSSHAQKLYVRMLTRKGNYFRDDKLQYEEIPCTTEAANELIEHQFLSASPNIDQIGFSSVFTKSEWLKFLKAFYPTLVLEQQLQKAKREVIDKTIEALILTKEQLSALPNTVYQLKRCEAFTTFKLLFFGNLYQDLTEFVVRDLGVFRFANYKIDYATRLFSDRMQVKNHLSFYTLTENLDEIMTSSEALLKVYHHLPKPDSSDRTLTRRINRTKIKIARQLERHNCLTQAVNIYTETDMPPSRERQARILAKLDQCKEAINLCKKIIDAPVNEEELVFAQAFASRIAKKAQLHWDKPITYIPPERTIQLNKSDAPVEVAAAEHFAKTGECFYVENSLFSSIFGLVYWDTIFTSARGAFTHPFQSRPHDLFDHDFFEQRKNQHPLANSMPITKSLDALYATYKEHIGCSNPFVYWNTLDKHLLALTLNAMSEAQLRAILERIECDIKNNRAGFPDLIYFPRTGGFELIEIKAPGDRLQKNQLRWMMHFDKHDIPHKLVNVEWC